MEGYLPDFSVHRASELGADEKLLFESSSGGSPLPLGADETISLNAWRPHTSHVGTGLKPCDAIYWREPVRLDRAHGKWLPPKWMNRSTTPRPKSTECSVEDHC
jgi:hypothetical protein